MISKTTSTDLSYKVNITAADDLETQGVRAFVSSHGTDIHAHYIVISKKTSTDLSYKVNITAADDLETQGVRASSVAMVLIYMYTIYSDLKENKHRSFIQSQYRGC